MWDFLFGLLEVASWLSFWRVCVAFLAGLLIGLGIEFAFAESSGFFAMFCAIAGMLPGYVWHRRAEKDSGESRRDAHRTDRRQTHRTDTRSPLR